MRWRIGETGNGRSLNIAIEYDDGELLCGIDVPGADASRFGQELIDAAIAMVSCKSDNPRRQPREGDFR